VSLRVSPDDIHKSPLFRPGGSGSSSGSGLGSACPAGLSTAGGFCRFRSPAEVVESSAVDGSAEIAGLGRDAEEDPPR
jgi:hypothetical protein